MKFLFDTFPVILFFVAYKVYDIYVATISAIIASLVQVAIYWYRHRKFEKVHLISLAIILVFGGATLLLKDKTFIMWKPTVLYWSFAVIFIYTLFFNEKKISQLLMSQAEIQAPANIWKHADIAFILLFIALGIANLVVANYFFESEHALSLLINGKPDIENCVTNYTGEILALCQKTKGFEETWVNFKLFGLTGISLLFTIAIGFYVLKNATNYDELVKSKL